VAQASNQSHRSSDTGIAGVCRSRHKAQGTLISTSPCHLICLLLLLLLLLLLRLLISKKSHRSREQAFVEYASACVDLCLSSHFRLSLYHCCSC
jgi:hypothetical protein